MSQLPSITSYGQYESSNYGLNTLRVNLGPITLFYSYKTIVAFWTDESGLVASQNIWSTTTGKHLTWIQSDKSKRIPHEQFTQQLESALAEHIR